MKNNGIENKSIRIEIDMYTLCCAVLSHVRLSATPWTVAHQAPLSTGFPRQEYWSTLSFPSPGDLPNPGIEHTFPALAGGFFTIEPPGKPDANNIALKYQSVKE